MSDTKHTPGPWGVELWENHETVIVSMIQNEAYDGISQRCPDRLRIATIRNGLQGQTGPNARLMAAAPELLEACKAAQQALRATSKAEKDYTDLCSLLRDAIAKATK